MVNGSPRVGAACRTIRFSLAYYWAGSTSLTHIPPESAIVRELLRRSLLFARFFRRTRRLLRFEAQAVVGLKEYRVESVVIRRAPLQPDPREHPRRKENTHGNRTDQAARARPRLRLHPPRRRNGRHLLPHVGGTGRRVRLAPG